MSTRLKSLMPPAVFATGRAPVRSSRRTVSALPPKIQAASLTVKIFTSRNL